MSSLDKKLDYKKLFKEKQGSLNLDLNNNNNNNNSSNKISNANISYNSAKVESFKEERDSSELLLLEKSGDQRTMDAADTLIALAHSTTPTENIDKKHVIEISVRVIHYSYSNNNNCLFSGVIIF